MHLLPQIATSVKDAVAILDNEKLSPGRNRALSMPTLRDILALRPSSQECLWLEIGRVVYEQKAET